MKTKKYNVSYLNGACSRSFSSYEEAIAFQNERIRGKDFSANLIK